MTMRLDQFLTVSRLLRPRSLAKSACEKGIVFINGRRAKPSSSVAQGDRLLVEFADGPVEVEIVEVPAKPKPLPAVQARALYSPLENSPTETTISSEGS